MTDDDLHDPDRSGTSEIRRGHRAVRPAHNVALRELRDAGVPLARGFVALRAQGGEG